MRKLLWILVVLIIGVCIAGWVVWANRADIAAHYLSKGLHVPVTIRSLDIEKKQGTIQKLWVGNPPKSKTNTSFSVDTIEIHTTWQELRGTPLTIDEIDLNNVFIGIEKYSNDPNDSNWAYILHNNHPSAAAKGKGYLIKTLVIQNLSVSVTSPDGTTKQYPTIERLEFHNISNETGFPVSQIEKAIFKKVMNEVIQKYSLDLLKSLNPLTSPANPVNWF